MGHGTIGDVMGESMLSVVFSSWPVDGGESVRIGSILQFESDVVMSKPKATVKDKAEKKEMSGLFEFRGRVVAFKNGEPQLNNSNEDVARAHRAPWPAQPSRLVRLQ